MEQRRAVERRDAAERRGGGRVRHDPVRRLLRHHVDEGEEVDLWTVHGGDPAGAGGGLWHDHRSPAAEAAVPAGDPYAAGAGAGHHRAEAAVADHFGADGLSVLPAAALAGAAADGADVRRGGGADRGGAGADAAAAGAAVLCGACRADNRGL